MYNISFTMLQNLLNPLKTTKRALNSSNTIINILETAEVGQPVIIQGWIKSIRKQKELTFLDVNDGSTCKNIQVTLSNKPDDKLTVNSSILTEGVIKHSPKGFNEVSANKLTILGGCDLNKGFPFAPRKTYEPEYIREFLHLRAKTRKFASIFRLRHAATLLIHNYLTDKGYFNVHTPIITSNDCEGAGETFTVKPGPTLPDPYFDTKAFLTVSGQLHLEACAQALNKVYCFGPTFRAENSRSRFHLSEFYMLELEQAFVTDLDDLVGVVEGLIKHVTVELLDKHHEDLSVVGLRDHSWLNSQFARLTHKEALELLQNKGHTVKGDDISKENELALTSYLQRPVFVMEWPQQNKPFYMKESRDGYVAAFDLLAPQVGEIVGGSLREDDYDKLKARLPNGLDWYLDLRKFGNVPTGGFGLGFERYLQFVLGVDNIKDCIPFPRWPHHCRL